VIASSGKSSNRSLKADFLNGLAEDKNNIREWYF
jgi:hypothetical protein